VAICFSGDKFNLVLEVYSTESTIFLVGDWFNDFSSFWIVGKVVEGMFY
jgi:hypothetical protein